MPDTGYEFNGVLHAEGQERENEHRSGVPGAGGGVALLSAPVRRTTGVQVANVGEEDAELRLRHAGAKKTQSLEHLTALAAGGNRYVGALARKKLVAKSVSITNAGAPLTIVDDGAGKLYDTGFIGDPTKLRGTIDYVNGIIDFTYGAAPTEPVRITYDHTDYTDFLSPSQSTSKAAAAFPFTLQLGYGRVNPFSVAITEGTPLTFVDDGKGNIIETTGGGAVKRGTIDYATGLVTLTGASGALAGTVTGTFTFNPFAALLRKAGSFKMLDVYSQIPEITGEAFADGVKGESFLGLWGQTRSSKATSLVTQWRHFGEEPYRVNELFSGFPAGGEINDPTLNHSVSHL
jgi:hypothetical protein